MLATLVVVPITAAAAQDVVVMRSSIAPPAPRSASAAPSWTTGDWSDWSTTCGAQSTRTRTVTCSSPESKCDAKTKPKASETDQNYSACTELLKGADFDAPNSAWTNSPWFTYVTLPDGRKVRSVESRGVYGQGSTYQVVGSLVPGGKYRFTFEYRRVGTLCPDQLTFRAQNSGTGGAKVDAVVPCPGTEWASGAIDFTAQNTVSTVYLYMGYSDKGYTTIQLDNASLKRTG